MPGIDDASGDLPVTGSVVVPATALSWRFSRSSGPGGQGVNTADSRVELSVAPMEIPGLTEHQQQRLAQRLRDRLAARGAAPTPGGRPAPPRAPSAARRRPARPLPGRPAPPPPP